jgi:16S rRNA processing protein RimM
MDYSDMDNLSADYFEIGKIINTVGIKGEIKVFPTTEDPKRFSLLKEIDIIMPDGSREIRTLQRLRYHKNLVILKLEGVNDPDAAGALRGGVIVVDRENALPCAEDEYYIPDLIGMNVITDEGLDLGVLKDVLVTGANDVYIVKCPNGKEVLIPAIKQCIIQVDVKSKKMVVHLLEGLL